MTDERKLHQLREALTDIMDLVDGSVDIDSHGQPNLAMQVYTVAGIALGRHEGYVLDSTESDAIDRSKQ